MWKRDIRVHVYIPLPGVHNLQAIIENVQLNPKLLPAATPGGE